MNTSNQISGEQAQAADNVAAGGGGGKSQTNNLENFRVAVRLRPFTERERQRQSRRIVDIEHNTVALYNPKWPDEATKRFTFDHSYWSHDGFKRNQDGLNVSDPEQANSDKYVDQEQVFEDLGRFLLENAIEGYNSALLAYGQTGSGKSYTVSGYGPNEGILPRFARELFAVLDQRLPGKTETASEADEQTMSSSERANKTEPLKTTETEIETEAETGTAPRPQATKMQGRFEVYFSMIEIYNEVVRDLLAKEPVGAAGQKGPAGSSSVARRGLRVREHPKRGFFVESLSSYQCSSKDEIESLIEEGQLNKSIAATSMNETSSRGHTIYEFLIKQFRPRESAAPPEPPKVSSSTPTGEPAGRPKPSPLPAETLTSSVVQLVDLAGSERMTVNMTNCPASDSAAAPRSPSRSSSPMPSAGQSDSITATGGGGSTMVRSRSSRSTTSQTPGSGARRAQNQTPSSASSSSSAATISRRSTANQNGGNGTNLLGPHHMNSQHQQRFKETVSINQSLSALGNCIQVLSQFSQQNPSPDSAPCAGKQPKIPYRDSVLTKLLNRCCLSGNSKVVLIATLSPADANYDDTLSTLRFADRAKQIRTHAVVNRSVAGANPEAGGVNTALQRENERLKQILDGRVTRSDDSSQTSNFDDSENMQENFQGPKGLFSSPVPQAGGSPSRKSRRDRTATVVKARASGGKAAGGKQAAATGGQQLARTTVAATTGTSKARGQANNQLAQENGPGSPPSVGASRESGAPGRSFRGRSQTIAAPPGTKLLASEAPDGGALGGRQMEQLVSPAETKMRKKFSRLPPGSISLEDETDGADEDYQDEEYEGETGVEMGAGLRKSQSVGQKLAGRGQKANASTYQLGSELLDEIDLNELANMIDDENPLSPDSDDSFNQSIARAKLDDNMSKQEKAAILNRLLSNSNVANRIIKKQIESSIKQVKLDRPKGAGASGKQHVRPMKRAELSGGGGGGGGGAGGGAGGALNSSQRSANPYLSNLNSDEQLSGVITYMIEPGEMIVGKDDSCDLLIFGPGLRGRHAKITRKTGSGGGGGGSEGTPQTGGECLIEPIFADDQEQAEAGSDKPPKAADSSKVKQARRVALLVNGEPVLGPVKLAHGDRLLFGSANYFVFLDEASRGGRSERSLETITYDMAHAEVMRKMMSETENEAMIREIKDYTHRPGTGRRERNRDHEEVGAVETPMSSPVGASQVLGSPPPAGAASDADQQEEGGGRQLGKIKEEEGEHSAPAADDLLYRGRLMADTYEFIIPTAEANAIADEMSIRVTYGLKILTGEEQLEPLMGADDQWQWPTASGDAQDDNNNNNDDEAEQTKGHGEQAQSGEGSSTTNVIISSEQPPIKPETLDIPPELYIHVHLDELGLDFYWTKEKFQERRLTMLELYGAWDVGGKSGLVEHLIEQSKYQGYYMVDPFVDDLRASWVLVGHAQVSLRPLSHAAPLSGRFDVIDVNDETVGSLLIEALPCENNLSSDEPAAPEWPYALAQSTTVLKEARELLDKKFVFLLRIVSCSRLSNGSRFAHLFCQYTLNRDQPTIRTRLVSGDNGGGDPAPDGDHAERQNQDQHQDQLRFEHRHFVVVERVTQDILDFLQHGFLTIQLVGQYASEPLARTPQAQSSSSSVANSAAVSAASSKQVARSSAGSSTSRSPAQPTLVSAIISSINKYRYRMEQQSVALQNLQFQQGGEYAQSLGTYSANSATYRLHSNSGPSSVTSASNLFDGQPEDDDAVGLLNGTAPNQENIIDMILTKRKLDRAENQLHYIKRTINIAEHHNKKHIPVRTVKKLLNSYGQELEGGGLEDMTAEVTAETKANNSKHSNCSIQ